MSGGDMPLSARTRSQVAMGMVLLIAVPGTSLQAFYSWPMKTAPPGTDGFGDRDREPRGGSGACDGWDTGRRMFLPVIIQERMAT